MIDETLQTDLEKTDILLEKIKAQSISFLNSIAERPTSTQQKIEINTQLAEQGLGAEGSLALFNQQFEPIIVASTGPRYWGFVTGGATPAAIMGDWLASVYDQNPQSASGQGDISAAIEQETIQLLLDLFGLPNSFLGGFVTGATLSNFTCLAVARQWVGKQLNKDIAKEGISFPIKILTATPHSSAIKSLAMLGIGSGNLVKVNVLEENHESININDLEGKIKALDNEPFILISSGGTVNTVDFDDFNTIASLKEKYHFWWHIDAAFGGFAACSPKYKHLLAGWESADSITIDCHKWLNVPYESAVFFVKEKHKVLQVETFQNSNAPYLGDPLENFSYLNFLPENSRRLRALPAWFSLTAYGKRGYESIVENCVDAANYFGESILASGKFELLAPIRLNTVCFTLAGETNQEKVYAFLSLLNKTGQVFMTPTVYNNKKGVRAAFVNWRTEKKDIDLAVKEMDNVLMDNGIMDNGK